MAEKTTYTVKRWYGGTDVRVVGMVIGDIVTGEMADSLREVLVADGWPERRPDQVFNSSYLWAEATQVIP